jgi:hypothetical protein
MKKFSFFALLLLLIHPVFSQKYLAIAKPADGDDWGYIDPTGNFVIAPQYRKALDFSEDGVAVVLDKKSKQFEFINTKGEKIKTDVTDFKLKEIFGFGVKGFNSGMVAIKVGEKWGYLNGQGKEVVKVSFDKANEFHEGYSTAQKGGINYILDKSGKEIEVKDPKISQLKNHSEGLIPFEAMDKKEGFVDVTGKIVIEPKFEAVGYFVGGLAWAKESSGKVGFIDKKGNWVIEPQFSSAKEFDAASGLARVKRSEQWEYVDKTGKVSAIGGAETVEGFNEGVCRGKKGGKWGFYDKTGKWIVEPTYDHVDDFQNGYAVVKSGKMFGVVDKTGKVVLEPKFGGLKEFHGVK